MTLSSGCILILTPFNGNNLCSYYPFLPSISIFSISYFSIVLKKVTIKKGHATYEQLQNPTIPIYKKFYFFNLTNAEDFHNKQGGVIPNFTEVGPYSYR